MSAGSTITVHRVDYTDRVETQAIPYDTEYVYTSLYFRNTGRATTVRMVRKASRRSPPATAMWTANWKTASWWIPPPLWSRPTTS